MIDGNKLGEAGLKYTGVSSAVGTFGTGGNQGDSRPAAYLNYILFDKNYKVLDAGWQLAPATTFTKQKLSLNTLTIKEPGYVYVYLSYDDDSNNWVYFDDFKVTHTKTNILQYNEYYPYGLQANTSWTRDNNKNNFLYNEGSEINTTTGWYDLPYRNYDAALGRFMQVDPLATQYASSGGYHYSYNNPMMFNDPSGAGYNDYPDYYNPGGMPGAPGVTYPYDNPTGCRYCDNAPTSGSTFDRLYDDAFNQTNTSYHYEPYGHYAEDAKTGKEIPGTRVVEGWNRVEDEEIKWETQGDPQTWYYMSREGTPHGMVYDPVGRVIYEVNQVPGHKWYDQLERLIFNSVPTNNVKAKVSIAYQYRRGNDAEWSSLWEREREKGSVYLLSPVTVSNPAAATAWFQGQTGNAWPYNLSVNNCAHYSVQGLNEGGAGINFLGPLPSSFPLAPTMSWTAGQPYPVSLGK